MNIQRIFDLVISIISLIFLSPLFLVISTLLKLTGEGEVFYYQTRVGKDRVNFQLIKFATMLKDSPSLSGGEITRLDDERILPFGHFLRKTKINELPQIINIMIGQMSFVGPRPLTPKTFSWYGEKNGNVIAKVKPGLTGVGSIIFRNEERLLSAHDTGDYYKNIISPYKSKLEIWYVQNKSFKLNCKIMILTALCLAGVSTRRCFNWISNLPAPPQEIAKEL